MFDAAAEGETKFHPVSFNEEYSNISSIVIASLSGEIRIEIGKVKIFIQANEIAILSSLVKELAKSC